MKRQSTHGIGNARCAQKWLLLYELFTECSAERGATWVVTGDVCLTYPVSDYIQLDTGLNLGITDAADDLDIFVGLSRRFC